MSGYQFENNASTTLGSALSNTATTATVATGTGNDFPSPAEGDWFMATLWAAGNTTGVPNEIVQVTSRSGDTMTIVRAQEGTTAQAWSVGDTFANYPTAAFLNELATEVDIQQQTGNSAGDDGTANAGVITLSPVPASLSALLLAPIRVLKVNSPNTGAYTLNVNGFGPQPVTLGGAPVPAGVLLGGRVFIVVWDGSNFELLSFSGVLGSSGVDADSYTNASITVNSEGLVTAAASGTPLFNSKFTSSGQTITGNEVSVAHGLGAQPFMFSAVLHCLTAELGYSVGDEVLLPSTTYNGAAGGGSSGSSPWASSTSVGFSWSSSIEIASKTGANATITTANWELIFRAFL